MIENKKHPLTKPGERTNFGRLTKSEELEHCETN